MDDAIKLIDPERLGAVAVLVAVLISMWRGWLVPGSIYNRAVADIDLKDKMLDRLTMALERLSRKRPKE